MKKTMSKIMIVITAALMVMMMAVPSFADTPSYPMDVRVFFITTNAPSTITDIGGVSHSISQMYVHNDTTYTSSFTTVIPGAYYPMHALMGVPTAMDAMYTCYGLRNSNNYTGWHSDWDTVNTPNGAYVDKMFNIPEYTTALEYNWNTHINTWKGYTWQIYLNTTSTANTWNSSTRKGKLPAYASNVQIQDGDKVYCRYMYTEESWPDD